MMAREILLSVSVEDGPFLPGEEVLGSLQFHPCEELGLCVFSISLIGEYYCLQGDYEKCEIFSSDSFILDLKGCGEGVNDIPFSLRLRSDLVPSIDTPKGGIRYRVTGQVLSKDSKNEKSADIKDTVFISVIVPKQISVDKSGKKQFIEDQRFCFCYFGAVTGDLEVAQTNLVCGSQAIINARIINSTRWPIPMTALSLVQKVVFKKEGRTFKYEVGKVERGSIMPGKQQVWLSERFHIPPLPPTRSDEFFDISYGFQMCIQKSPSKALKVKIPIVVGNFMGSELPKTWKDVDGVEFWVQGGSGQRFPGIFFPLYATYCF